MSEPTKSQLRRELRSARKAHPDRETASREIVLALLKSQSAFQQAAAIAWYVDAGSEVITRTALRSSLEHGREIVHAAPYCDGDELMFYALQSWNELESGQFGILAPKEKVRGDSQRYVKPEQFDVILVPAVGFDRKGNRLGQGKGFYDRFLSDIRDDAVKIGLAFDCQIADSLPSADHDVPVDVVITESGVTMVSD